MTNMRMINKFEEKASAAGKTKPQRGVRNLGVFYVHDAAPKKGTRVSPEGTCEWVLECYRIADGSNPKEEAMTPGQIAGMVCDPAKAEFIAYEGPIATTRHDAGLMLGQVCRLSEARGSDYYEHGVRMDRATKVEHLAYMPPKGADYAADAPYFGKANNRVMSFKDGMAIASQIAAAKDYKYVAPRLGRGCVI